MPEVSIIIPTYKRTAYLEKTLHSIMRQTFQDFEVIVVDDGTPNEENRLLCQQFEKVHYIKITNSGGPARPRNTGIRAAKGHYIAFVDDDDLWLPEKLEKQVTVLKQNPEFGLVHGCCEIIDENDVLQNQIIGRPGTPEVKHGDVSLRMMGNWTVMMPTSFVRKEVVDKVGFFNEQMPSAGEDTEYWNRCSFETQFYYMDEPLVHYRVHSNNISKANAEYIKLPFFLKNVLKNKLLMKRITKQQYSLLLDNLTKSQIKMMHGGFFKTFGYLQKINPFWFLNLNHLKLFIYILFFKKRN